MAELLVAVMELVQLTVGLLVLGVPYRIGLSVITRLRRYFQLVAAQSRRPAECLVFLTCSYLSTCRLKYLPKLSIS